MNQRTAAIIGAGFGGLALAIHGHPRMTDDLEDLVDLARLEGRATDEPDADDDADP